MAGCSVLLGDVVVMRAAPPAAFMRPPATAQGKTQNHKNPESPRHGHRVAP